MESADHAPDTPPTSAWVLDCKVTPAQPHIYGPPGNGQVFYQRAQFRGQLTLGQDEAVVQSTQLGNLGLNIALPPLLVIYLL